jgi:Penicillinase repressor
MLPDPHELPRPTDAELEILTILWSLGPSTVRDVHETITRRKPAQYTTVLKTLQIMAEKGLVKRDEKARAHIYSAARPREWTQATARRRPAAPRLRRVGGQPHVRRTFGPSRVTRRVGGIAPVLGRLRKGKAMSQLAAWIHAPLAQSLGRTLAHFLWEGTAIAALLVVPTRRRYALACFALAAMPLAFAVTLAIVWMPPPAALPIPLHWTAMPAATATIAIAAPSFSWTMVLDRLGWLVPVWFAGVAFFYLRGLAGWAAVQALRRRGVCAAPPEWQAP